MLKLKTVKREIKTTDTVESFDLINKYYWHSRSVYAIEFKENVYRDIPDAPKIHEIHLFRVQFELHIITHRFYTFTDDQPIELNRPEIDWVSELLQAYTKPGYFDSRTKEQFDTDYNKVIEHLKNLR